MDSRNTLQLQPFDPPLKRRLKANAALEGLTMSEVVATLVEGWCEEREAKRAARTEVTERGKDHAR
jgi:hypothetical protein